MAEKARSWVLVEVVEGLNESFIRSTERERAKGERGRAIEKKCSRKQKRRKRLFNGERH